MRNKSYDKKFKEDAVRYYKEHEGMTLKVASTNLGIGCSTLSEWVRQADKNKGEVPVRGSGNYASDEAKENARLKRELRDAQDALEILKKAIGILGD